MCAAFDKFKDIHYQKITWEEFDKLTPEVIKDIIGIDTLVHRRNVLEFKIYLNSRLKDKEKTIIYLMYNGNEMLGSAIGHLRKVSTFYSKDYNVSANPTDNYFHLTEMNINPKYQKLGLGLLLKSRVVADQRVNYNSRFVYSTAAPDTQKINGKITGERFIKIDTKEKDKEGKEIIIKKEILRNFKNSRFKYDLFNSPEKMEPSKKQYILINPNPNYKKREIRSRAK